MSDQGLHTQPPVVDVLRLVRKTKPGHLILWIVRTQWSFILLYHTLKLSSLGMDSLLSLIKEFFILLEIPAEVSLVPV